MNNQEQSIIQRRISIPMEVTPIYIKPRRGIETANGDAQDDHLGIYLPYDSGEVQTGSGSQWNLSIVPVTAPIQGFTIYEGGTEPQDYNETNLNCLTFSGPKRIEIVTSDDLDAAAYLVFQEVIEKNMVTGWQIYAPVAFDIVDSSHMPSNTWQYAVSTEPVSIKQVRLFESCNFSIETTPPPIPGALFQKVATKALGEVDLWR